MPSLAAGLSVLRVSVVVGAYNGKKLILIGRVGTGFPQKLLRWLEPRLKQLEQMPRPSPSDDHA